MFSYRNISHRISMEWRHIIFETLIITLVTNYGATNFVLVNLKPQIVVSEFVTVIRRNYSTFQLYSHRSLDQSSN